MKLSIKGLSVFIGMPSHRDIPVETAISLIRTQYELLARRIENCIAINYGSSVVTSARNRTVDEFLKTDCNRLFWIDSDMVWEPSAFIRILALTSRLDCVMAAYRTKKDPETFIIDADGRIETNEYGCLPGVGTGLGFCCVRREVIERLADKAQKLIYPEGNVLAQGKSPIARIFYESERDGHFMGEDIAFFRDIKSIGYEVNLDPNVTLGHVGQKVFSGKLIDHLEEISDGTDRTAAA